MNLEEDFRDIPGYEGLYQVSNLGRVKGLYRNIIKGLKTTKDGYLEVGLSKNGIEKKYRVHRLVAITFKASICSVTRMVPILDVMYTQTKYKLWNSP